MLLNSLMETNNLEQAIAYNPLIVTPDTLVTDAISLMSNARASCTLKNISSDTNYLLADARASCVLVMEDKQLVGIFTKRDVVHLNAEGRQIGGMVIGAVMTHSVITIQQSDFNEELREIIFAKYEVGNLITGGYQIGLGLAFCKMVIEVHGGCIKVEENYPTGAIFIVEI